MSSTTAPGHRAGADRLQTIYDAVRRHLFAPVDGAALAYFRIAFGLIMLWEVFRYFNYGWIVRYWNQPVLNFPYYGFEWLKPLPGNGMVYLFAALGVLAALITVGLFYRISITLFFIGFTYSFLLEQARYLNHFYLICLLAFIMIFLPLHRVFSLDAVRNPSLRASQLPAWTLWLLRFQIGVPYFFGGIAKINADWLQAEPIRAWLGRRTDFPLIGRFFADEWMVYTFAYGGLLLDLLVVPFLLWRRTRPFAYAAALTFHITNARLFSIGIFPWFMIAATLIFFDPAWPRQAVAGLQRWMRRTAGSEQSRGPTYAPPPLSMQHVVLTLFALWVAFQCVFPLRHVLYPGNPSWTEEGHRYAWHMKLRGKSGHASFRVYHADSDTTWVVQPKDYLPRWQERKMLAEPDMIIQFAHFLARKKREEGYDNVAVYAEIKVSLNGRRRQPFVDPEVDLTKLSTTIRRIPWVLPLTEPLPRRSKGTIPPLAKPAGVR